MRINSALFAKIPYSTTVAGAAALVEAIAAFKHDSEGLSVTPLQDYVATTRANKQAA